jgi:uncharacterized protein YkwD
MPYRKLPIAALVVAVLLTGTASRVDADDLTRRNRMLRLLNQTRSNHGLRAFRLNVDLSHYAWKHSKKMAERGRLSHTYDLYSKVRTYSPSTWGENVGAAGWPKKLRRLWMNSSAHRYNILKPAFRRIGIGVVKARGKVWATTIFYGG